MTLLLSNKLMHEKSRQNRLINEIDNFLQAEEKYRASLRRFLARIEAHKPDYLYFGVKVELYNELHAIISEAINLSQTMVKCLAEDVSIPVGADKYPDSIVRLSAVKDRINTFLTGTHTSLELQEMFFASSKANYFAEYVPENFKQRDSEFAISAAGGGEPEDKVAVSIERVGKAIKTRLNETSSFLHKMADMGLGIDPVEFDKIIINGDALVKYRLLDNKLENIIKVLNRLVNATNDKIDNSSELQKVKKQAAFKAKRDDLKDLLLLHMKHNGQDIVANQGHRRAVVKKILELMVKNAAYYRFLGEDPAISKFQKNFGKEIDHLAEDKEKSLSGEAAALILQDMLDLLKIKYLDQLGKSAGINKINDLAKKRYFSAYFSPGS